MYRGVTCQVYREVFRKLSSYGHLTRKDKENLIQQLIRENILERIERRNMMQCISIDDKSTIYCRTLMDIMSSKEDSNQILCFLKILENLHGSVLLESIVKKAQEIEMNQDLRLGNMFTSKQMQQMIGE